MVCIFVHMRCGSKILKKVDSQLYDCGTWNTPVFALLVGGAIVTGGLSDLLIGPIAPSAYFSDGATL